MNKEKKFAVVGIGASAGGLDAIQQLFDHMPMDTGMAFIIIQHLSPDFKSLMPELLAKHTKMQIFTAEDKQTIRPNCIYLNQRNKNLHIKGNRLYLLDKGPKHNLNLPIDIFFHTLGEEYKEKSIGIILSGTGSDGSRGIKTIKEAGGTLIVQDPNSAQFDGMPNSAIATNLVDYILPPDNMSEALFKYPNKRLVLSGEDNTESNDALFFSILEEVYKTSGIDFRLYKKNTLLRRLEKRMNINNIDLLFDYHTFIKSNAKELEALKLDFLIGVTSFFRDTEAFASLKANIIPEICRNKKDAESVRIWVPGCSSGEEVYSIAILFDEHIRKNNYKFDFKIFATDVDVRAINAAGSGSFNINIANEIEKTHLEHYFLKTGDKIQIIKRIREKIVFSTHNVLKDPPFIRMDLITCRNMLIYFENRAQNRVMTNFQFSLNKFGYLFLGNSESLGVVSKLFKTIDSKWKIYQNISETKRIPSQEIPENRVNTYTYKSTDTQVFNRPEFRFKENPETIFHKFLSKKHSPASIFIDKDFEILFIKGNAGKRLSHSEGIFQRNLLRMVTPEIASIIRNAIRKLEINKKDIVIKNVVNKGEDEVFTFDLSFHKPNENSNLNNVYLVQFSEDKKVTEKELLVIDNLPVDEISKQRFEDLENELKATKVELQNVVEELETSNEELQSSNEELMASNEELQSTNEELQSVNEELYTVNSELQEKNKELININDDVKNLLDSTAIGTLFLDTNFRIRKFTPALQQLFNLQEVDEGRPISSFASNFNDEVRTSIINDCKIALKELKVIEKEINDLDGNAYLKRISPFITTDKKIDGVVISFVGINKIKDIQKELIETENRYQKLFENLNEGFAHAKIITDKKGKPIDWEYITVNPAFEKQTGLKRNDIVGKPISKLTLSPSVKEDHLDRLELYGETSLTGKDQFIENYSASLDKYFLIHIFCPKIGEFAATFTDITDIKQKENALIEIEAHLKNVQEISKVGSWVLNIETNEVNWTEELYNMYGFDPTLPVPPYNEQQKLFTTESWELLSAAVEKTKETGIPYEVELQTIKADGTNGWMWARGEVTKDAAGKTIGLWGAAQDITERKNLLEKIKFEKQFSQQITDSSTSGIYIYNIKEGTNTFMNNQYEKILGYTINDINAMSYEAFMSLFHADDVTSIQQHMQKVYSGEEHSKIEYRFKHKQGHWVWCYSIDSPFEYDSNGDLISFIGVFIDISEKKKVEEQLVKSVKIAEAANIYKNQFLANMSHEIRTPMNGIVGFADLLKVDNLTPLTRNRYIDIIKNSSNQLLNLINDIIDVSKIEADELKLSMKPCNLNKLVSNLEVTYAEIKHLKDKGHINITASIPKKHKELIIETDPLRLQQVLVNLINNALKFSEKGTIEFGFDIIDNSISFFVKDAGFGIPQEKIDLIFNRFEQLEQVDPGKNEGTGLGLAISKGIVDLFEGKFEVQSVVGKGTTFSFTLPLVIVEESNIITSDYIIEDFKTAFRNKTILVAEDDPINIEFFKAIFSDIPCEVLYATQGNEAVKLYLKHSNIDVVLMDIKMPVLNGVEAAKQILAHDKQAKIIAQTANAMASDADKYLNYGFVDYISKPINKDKLLNKIVKLIV